MKKDKIDDYFYRNPKNNKIKINDICIRCIHNCKQSYKSELIACRKYESKYKERKYHE